MKIKVLGTRGEIEPSAPYHIRHSGVLVDGVVLFDCGEQEFLGYRPSHVLVTHLHPDHAFFILHPAQLDMAVYAPEPYSGQPQIQVMSGEARLDGYSVTPVPTHHSKLVKSTAYLLARDGQRLLYTGDIVWINKEHHPLLSGLDLVITDGSFIRKGGFIRKDPQTGQIYGHAGIPDLVRMFKPFTHHILFVHFGAWFYPDIKAARRQLKDLGERSGVAVHVGYDGMELDLAQLSPRQERL